LDLNETVTLSDCALKGSQYKKKNDYSLELLGVVTKAFILRTTQKFFGRFSYFNFYDANEAD